ncbi:peptide chain release factor aRF-1 [Methanobrevibacter curvatus]|uniref:Peptide chain release factor subunit 1 n=1 Tax=Methanobrevibacter curvatus TaxID=49547 RepID=A0A166CIR4_9EURY|nr:peptide chain release factor aRF-1 [Methanobrevibacter curvatus]KZX14552.1 peptide chain release factor 1 [Methanobrevibacter curvatus]
MSEISSKELYEFKRTLNELKEKKGRGTELVSVYIPHDKQLSDVAKHMRDELGQSANIKSKQTRKNVQSAIEVIIQRLRLFPRAPENGLVLFVGMIPKGGPGTEKMETYVFTPPEAIITYTYHCNSEFYLEPLQYMMDTKEIYGVTVLDRKEATIATLKGKRIDILKHLTSGVPGKHKAGGQSQRRFDRLIDLAAHEFKKRIGDHMNDVLLPIEDLQGLLIGGPGHTKEEFLKGDYLNYELHDKVIASIDTSYTGEFGIREIIDKSSDILSDIEVMKEKKLVGDFLKELIHENGLAAYGEEEINKYLIMGAVDTLLISEDLEHDRHYLKCVNCGNKAEITYKSKADESKKICTHCGEPMKTTEIKKVIDHFVDLADEYDTDVEIISTETEEGVQLLKAFGGVAAILRYRP